MDKEVRDKEERRYDQPFCVINSRGHFVGARFNYLPRLLEEPDITDAPHIEQNKEWSVREWDIINQLRGEVKHIHKDLHELQATRKKVDYY